MATAPGCKPGTLRYTGFESGTEYHIVGDSPSWSRHWILIPALIGSNPISPTKLSQSGEVVSRQAHNLKTAGAIPASATRFVNFFLGQGVIYVYALQENVMSQYDIIAQVRELLERNLNSFEIAHRLCLDLNQVLQIIATL